MQAGITIVTMLLPVRRPVLLHLAVHPHNRQLVHPEAVRQDQRPRPVIQEPVLPEQSRQQVSPLHPLALPLHQDHHQIIPHLHQGPIHRDHHIPVDRVAEVAEAEDDNNIKKGYPNRIAFFVIFEYLPNH